MRNAAMAMLAAVFLAGADEERDAGDLAWLAGDWAVEEAGRWTEERWAGPRGGVMLGTSLSGRGDRATGFEFMRIAAGADGALAFWGSPGGSPAVPFRLVRASGTEAVFENPAHDYPQRIVYRREGDLLTATISAIDGTGARSWRYARR